MCKDLKAMHGINVIGGINLEYCILAVYSKNMTKEKMMRDISIRSRFIKVYNYNDFNKKLKNHGYVECQKFVCTKAPSLEKFFRDDINSSVSIYIVYDTNAKIVVGYYTLMATCMIRDYESHSQEQVTGREIRVQKNIPCIEIEKFAINEKYLAWLNKKNYNSKRIGYYVFWEYISKTIAILSAYINFSFIILHAIKHEKVIQAYRNMEFETFEDDEMNIVSLLDGVTSIKESYVDDCKFMYMPLETILTSILKGGK